jgi:hypothetical protein
MRNSVRVRSMASPADAAVCVVRSTAMGPTARDLDSPAWGPERRRRASTRATSTFIENGLVT